MNGENLLIKKNAELEAVLEASRVLTTSFDLDVNLSEVMQTLSSKLELQRGCVFLLDPIGGELKIVAAHGLSKEEIRRGKYRIGEGIVGTVISNDTPMYIPDIGEEPRFLNRTGSRPDKKGISFICVPITLEGRPLGVLSVDRIYAAEHGSVEDDLRVLSIMASMIAQIVGLWETYRRADEEKEALRTRLKKIYGLPNVIGESERFQGVLKSVRKVASTDATVLLLGESGTGKELIANAVHFSSPRASKPFVAVNCAALPANLLEVELFGCEKGAFTGATARRIGRFETAQGGTIFLDEIGELPMGLQAKLLRVLQERQFERVGSSLPIAADVRVIAATNKDLNNEVVQGNFREDLYWRLNVVPVVLPSLRERKGDVRLLVRHYLEIFNKKYDMDISLSEDAMDAMDRYSWPGNVRELANTVERLVIMSEKPVLTLAEMPVEIVEHRPDEAFGGPYGFGSMNGPVPDQVQAIERNRIERALVEYNYNQRKAADALGYTPRQLGYRIKKFNIAIA